MKTMKIGILSCCLAGILGAVASGGEIYLVPVEATGSYSIDGNEIILDSAGQWVFLEIMISDWDPDLDGTPKVRSWQTQIDSSGYSSGLAGTLTPAEAACVDDYDCRAPFGGVCSLTGESCLVDTDCPYYVIGEICGGAACDYPVGLGGYCSPGFQFAGRPDGLLLKQLPAVDVSSLNFRYGSTTSPSGSPVADPGTPMYGGTLVLDVPLDAMGTFTVGLSGGIASFLRDADGNDILPLDLTGALITVRCYNNQDCDDGNPCTNNLCSSGHCFNPNNTAPCDDGDPCNVGEACSGGICTGGAPPNCSAAGDDCNTASCDPAGGEGNCDILTPVENGTPCSDGLFCTDGEFCTDGDCGDGLPHDCSYLDDQCNEGVCNENQDRCDASPINEGWPCDDGLFCTDDDTCTSGECTGPEHDCSYLDDQCLQGVCNEDLDDCEAVAIGEGLPCDDEDPCNVGETCQSGACTGGGLPDCSQAGDDCNAASCDPFGDEGNCDVYTPANEGLPCDDGLYCTVDEFCTAGSCGDGVDRDCDDLVGCTDDWCDDVGDRCMHDPNDGLCPDDELWCNGSEYCDADLDCWHTGSPCSGPCDEENDKCLCDAPIVEGVGGRYLRIAVQPVESGPQAIVVTPDCPGGGDAKYVGLPVSPPHAGGAYYASLVDNPAQAVFLTPEEWGELYVYGLDIVPSHTYLAQGDCGSPGVPGLSEHNSASTPVWGDSVGDFVAGHWTPPNGIVDFVDIVAELDTFKATSLAAPIYRTDLVGPNGNECLPNQQVNFLDIASTVDAFRGFSYLDSHSQCSEPCP